VKQLTFLLCLLSFVNIAHAEAIAQSPNEGNGFIVLTNEVCKIGGKTFKELNRVYSYTARGDTQDGCFMLEDTTVVVVWESGNKKRYPASSFTLINRGSQI
jgi:hypothetical protein